MAITVESEQETMQEALAILLKQMPASKVARLLCAWQVGHGDYTVARRQLFAGQTVDDLFKHARALEKKRRKR